MKQSKNSGLQKLTDLKLTRLLRRKKIGMEDIRALNRNELIRLGQLTTEKLNKLKGVDRDKFYEKVEAVLTEDTKNALWEHNHRNIITVISNSLISNNRLLSVQEISDKVSLSRTTIYKHLAEFSEHPLYTQEFNKFKLLTSNLLTIVYKNAIDGDTSAAKLFFNVCGMLQGGQPPSIGKQNNYLIINGITITQEKIAQLKPEQVATIEGIVKSIPEAIPIIENINS